MAQQSEGSGIEYALECKVWWVDRILQGSKVIEIRQYPLPEDLLGVKIWLASTSGEDGQAVLGDSVSAGQLGGRVAGWVIFSGVKQYSSSAEFQQDEAGHCVTQDSVYAWKEGQTSHLYGWEVVAYQALVPAAPLPAMHRLHRSLYKLDQH